MVLSACGTTRTVFPVPDKELTIPIEEYISDQRLVPSDGKKVSLQDVARQKAKETALHQTVEQRYDAILKWVHEMDRLYNSDIKK